MFNIGGGEFLIILLAALVILGPSKLPEAARTVGKVIGEFRRISAGFQAELKDAMDDPVGRVVKDAESSVAAAAAAEKNSTEDESEGQDNGADVGYPDAMNEATADGDADADGEEDLTGDKAGTGDAEVDVTQKAVPPTIAASSSDNFHSWTSENGDANAFGEPTEQAEPAKPLGVEASEPVDGPAPVSADPPMFGDR